jgi:sulfite reductase (NADPH) flavoprotein alpha-component
VAFSRDSDQKVYVQHKLLENADEVYRWLQQGAHFYICGDRVKLAGDVQAALLKIIVEKGNFSIDEAQEYLNNLQKDKRLQLDVY